MLETLSVDFLITCLYLGKFPAIRFRFQIDLSYLEVSFSGNENGENFQLMVFVNDVNQAVTEGADGIEHM